MQKVALIFFIAFELCYYLLIAQTGIVEYFGSNIMLIAPLPLGGIIGSIFSYYLKANHKTKITAFLSIQLGISFTYPEFNAITLFILGISVGALAPLLINELKKTTPIELGIALSISYALGTFLFTYEVSQRLYIAVIFTLISLIASQFLPKKELKNTVNTTVHPLFLMILWVFFDSTLFETLSRDLSTSIWRDGYTLEIMSFHMIGIIGAFYLKLGKSQKELLILSLFSLSYLLYFLHEALLLSIIYPFVISYYNIVILQTLIKKDFKTISIYMVFIGWIASGAGLFVALENLILYVPIIFLVILIKTITPNQSNTKEIPCIN
jgi:beta-carotene 15,15'-dioxygenase